ncbi:MAG: leucyl aminopeptidase [Nocardioidaceae bacterium]
MTTASLSKTSPRKVKAAAVVIGVHSHDDGLHAAPGGEEVAAAYDDLSSTLERLGASAKVGDVVKLPSAGATKAPLLVAVGLGDGHAGEPEPSLETLRRAAGAATRALAGCGTAALALPADSDDQVRAVAEGALLGGYAYDDYLTKKAEPVDELIVLTPRARAKSAQAAVATATSVATGVNFARDLVNTPANDLYPESFATQLRSRSKKSKVTVTVTDETALEDKGYGGILGVGKGSDRPPRLVKMTYKPAKARTHLALVGKGITFDSGGLSIKPGPGMMTMKCDMAGAAAISAAVFAIAELELPVRVTAYACLAENMPSAHATRPGDVLTMYGGTTVEVLNTDAEGRLVLADGITTANADKPDLLVDVATLTGACVVGLGKTVAGVFSNDDDLHQELPRVAGRAGESMWPMPIPEEMGDKVHTTKIADLSQHNPEPVGGASYAAAFLREFVGDGITWAHLDIAGPAFTDAAPSGYTPKGATGAAVRTLVQLATERAR